MLSVIIPNFNGLALLQSYLLHNWQCLTTLGVEFEVIIVDDASTDQSVSYVQQHFPQIKISQNTKNLGFSRTVNIGARLASFQLLLFLNNDMQITSLNLKAIQLAFQDPTLFSITPNLMIVKQNNKNEALTWGKFEGGYFHFFSNPLAKKQEGTPILWGCGGGVFIEAKKFWLLGGFDELYSPFYVEDADLGYRAWKRGWKNLYTANTEFAHHHQGTILRFHSQKEIAQIYQRNKYLFIWKNIDDPWFWSHHLCAIFLKLLFLDIRDIRAICSCIKVLPQIIRKRRAEKPFIVLSDRKVLALTSSVSQ